MQCSFKDLYERLVIAEHSIELTEMSRDNDDFASALTSFLNAKQVSASMAKKIAMQLLFAIDFDNSIFAVDSKGRYYIEEYTSADGELNYFFLLLIPDSSTNSLILNWETSFNEDERGKLFI